MKALTQTQLKSLKDFKDFLKSISRIFTQIQNKQRGEESYSLKKLNKIMKVKKLIGVIMPPEFSEQTIYCILGQHFKVIKKHVAWEKGKFCTRYSDYFNYDFKDEKLIVPNYCVFYNKAHNYAIIPHAIDRQSQITKFVILCNEKDINEKIKQFNSLLIEKSPMRNKIVVIGNRQISFVDCKKLGFSDVILNNDVKEEYNNLISLIENYDKLDKSFSKISYILNGAPGTGKTTAINHCVETAIQSGFTVFYVIAQHNSDSEFNIAIELSKSYSPSLIVVEDFDLLSEDRYSYKNNVSNNMLQKLSGIEEINCIMLFSTNRFDVIDRAIKRAGRIDRKLFIDLPDQVSKLKLIRLFKSVYNINEDTNNIFHLIQNTQLTGADIKTAFEFCARNKQINSKDITLIDIEKSINSTIELKKEVGFH